MSDNKYAKWERRQRIKGEKHPKTREQRQQTFKRWQRVVIVLFLFTALSLLIWAVKM